MKKDYSIKIGYIILFFSILGLVVLWFRTNAIEKKNAFSMTPVNQTQVKHDPSIPVNTANGILKVENGSITGPANTDDLPEGKVNLYFNKQRVVDIVKKILKGLTTSDIKEGQNKYFTQLRVWQSLSANMPILFEGGLISLKQQGITNEYLAEHSIKPNNLLTLNQPQDNYALLYDSAHNQFKWASVISSYQNLSWDNNTKDLSIDNGNTVNLSDLLQTLNYDSNTYQLSIDQGNLVDLSSLHDIYAAGTGLDLTGNTFSLNASIDLLTDVDTSTNTPTTGQVLKWDGNNWVPQDDNDVLANLACTNGQIAKWNGSTWVCAEDNDTNTTYTAGNGLQLTGTEFSVNAPTCNAGEVLTWDGTQFACVQDQDTDTTYTAGRGLTLTGTTFETNTPTTSCASGEVLTWDGNNFVCTADQDTTYTASGTLLQLTGTTFSIKEGTLTDGSLCIYDATNGLVCNTDINSVGTDNQTLSWDASTDTLSISNGNNVDLSDLTQTLSLSGTQLSISSGNTVDFSGWDTNASDDVTKFTQLADTPNDYGSAGYLLQTDGSGAISYVDPLSLDVGYWARSGNVLSPRNAGDNIVLNSGESLSISDFSAGGLVFADSNGKLIQNANSLFWDNTNNRLGIGTTAPLASLQVQGGEIWLFNDSNNPRFVIGDNSNTGEYGWLQWDSNNNYFRIDTSASSATGLKIADNTIAIGNIYPSSDSVFIAANNSTQVFRIYDNGDIQTSLSANQGVYTDANGILTTTIPSSGNIGFWNRSSNTLTTANANDNLVIDGNATFNGDIDLAGQLISNLLPNNASVYDIGSTTTPWQDVFANTLHGNLQTNLTTGSITFIDSSGNLSENNSQLFWDNTNNRLGIGTSSPTAKLQVTGQTRSSSFASANGSASLPAYRFYNDTHTGLFLPQTGYLAFATNSTERMLIDSSGNVGINTSTPQSLLDINGTLTTRGISNFLASLYIKNLNNYALEQDFGNGQDGDVTISNANTVVNTYAYLTGNVNAGSTTLDVNSTSGFSAGDLVMIIQMQDGDTPSNVGTYEFRRVSSVASSTQLVLDQGITNSYTSGTFNSTNSKVTQVIKVPEYNNLTIADGASITANAWNGYTGGIVAIKALGTITFQGTGKIDVKAKGYRGGSCNGCGNNAWGQQGEGIGGIGQNSLSNNLNGGGGGYGPSGYNGEPGAGGGCATSGKDGVSSYTSKGGSAVCKTGKLIMGGGAGAGGDDDNKTPLPQYVNGGGAVFISARTVQNADIDASGQDGIAPGGPGGTTGGGAGGTVMLYFTDLTENTINVSGGKGGVDSDDKGGDGGDGLIDKHYEADTNILFYADVNSGHVGIKNPSPEYELDVGGKVRAVQYLTYSDKRLKTNIKRLQGNLSKLLKIKPVEYNIKISNDNKVYMGVLAQDVQKEFPQLVSKDKNGVLSVDYIGLIAPLIGSVQELNAKVDALKTNNNYMGFATNNGALVKLNKLEKTLKDLTEKLKQKIETKHLVAKTVRTEQLEVNNSMLLGENVAGTIKIAKGQTQAVVKSDAMRTNSVVIVTQNAQDFSDKVDYIITKQDKQFILKIPMPANKDLYFDYIIFNRQQTLKASTNNTSSCSLNTSK